MSNDKNCCIFPMYKKKKKIYGLGNKEGIETPGYKEPIGWIILCVFL